MKLRHLMFWTAITLAVVNTGVLGDDTASQTNRNTGPLSMDRASSRTVWVKNRDGKGIENVKVIVDYTSAKHPPKFTTDSQGKAEVQVRGDFVALQVDAGDYAIHLTVRASQVEWPFEITLPTRKEKF
jgi:hypothetical protein